MSVAEVGWATDPVALGLLVAVVGVAILLVVVGAIIRHSRRR
jgi:hypothetical protein